MKPAIIGPEIFSSLQDRLSPPKAIFELTDNSIDAGATKILIEITETYFRITDNGAGLANPNLIMVPGRGELAADILKIGGKKIGAKDAQACWGMRWSVQTVHKATNKYHAHTVDWQEALNRDRMIFEYDGAGANPSLAPAAIRAGGTIIKVDERRHDGVQKYSLPHLIKKMSQVYRAAIRDGVEITISKDGDAEMVPDIGADRSWFHPI